jgi:cyclophilin family peptidyl-prolyl cis-trans isomerase
MTLVPSQFRARRLATVGIVALLLAGCTAVPTVTPTPSPTAAPTSPPTTPPYTLGPTISPSPNGCPTATPAAFTGTAAVTMTTNFGNIVIKVDGSLGANAAGSFVALARCGYYNNVIFHRVIPGFVIQSGDGTYAREPNLTLSKMGVGGPDWKVQDDKVTTTYKRGTVSMARTGAVNSGNSQFFIVLNDSAQQSLGATTANNYAIFGSVTTGMDVVDRIALVPLGGEPGPNGEPGSMPLQPIVITSTLVTTP